MAFFKHKLPYSPSQKVNTLDNIPDSVEFGEPPSPIQPVSPVFDGDKWIFHTTSFDSEDCLNVAKISPPAFASTPHKVSENVQPSDSQETIIYDHTTYGQPLFYSTPEESDLDPTPVDPQEEVINVDSITTPPSVQIISETDLSIKSVQKSDINLDQPDQQQPDQHPNVDKILEDFKKKAYYESMSSYWC